MEVHTIVIVLDPCLMIGHNFEVVLLDSESIEKFGAFRNLEKLVHDGSFLIIVGISARGK